MTNDDGNSAAGQSRRTFLITTTALGVSLAAPWVISTRKAAAAPPLTTKDPRFSVPVIDPRRIAKFIDPLPVPGGTAWPIISAGSEIVRLVERRVRILPSTLGLNTLVWCYRGNTEYRSTFLGPTLLATSGISNDVTYNYSAVPTATGHLLKNGTGTASIVDKYLHGTDLNEPEVRFIAHLHGAKGVSPESDGYAESWSTPTATVAHGSGPSPLNAGSTSTPAGRAATSLRTP